MIDKYFISFYISIIRKLIAISVTWEVGKTHLIRSGLGISVASAVSQKIALKMETIL